MPGKKREKTTDRRSTTRALLLLLAGSAIASCDERTDTAAPVAVPPPGTTSPAAADIAPPPFTAGQIRAATHVGRFYEFSIEAPGRPTIRRRMTFTAVDAEGCTIESTLLDETGEVSGVPIVSHARWVDLVSHASYPAGATEIADTPVKTPAGAFDCWCYTVREGDAENQTVTHAYFAKDMPGAPVKLVVEKGGKLVSRLELVSYLQIGK